MSTRTRTALRPIVRKYLDINDFIDYVFTLAVQGSHTSPSTVWVQATNPEGSPLLQTDWLRVRVVDAIGSVTSTTVVAGSGYSGTPVLTFTAAPAGGTTATGTMVLSSGGYGTVTITNAGAGYVTAPTVTVSGLTGGTGGSVTANLSTGYAASSTATIAASSFSEITAINVLLGGQNYISVPTVTISGGGGTGATAVAVVSNPTAAGGTTVVATNTSGTDLTFQSNNQGLFSITLTDTTKNVMTLLLGAPPVANHLADYRTQFSVTHA